MPLAARALGSESVAAKQMRVGIEDAFWHDVLAHPDEDAPRLIYADWLDEHNDPRGEFIRVQCALAQLSDEDPRRWPLELREQELLREHTEKWLPKGIKNVKCIFRRGFVEEITVWVGDSFPVVEQIFLLEPIQCIHIFLISSRTEEQPIAEGTRILQRLISWSHLARLRGLHLHFAIDGEGLRKLSESICLDHLTHLTLQLANRDALRFLVTSFSLTNLRQLNLSGNGLTHEGARILAEGRLLSQLETLHLESNLLGDAGAMAIRDWPALPRLTRLRLGHNQMFAAGVQALAQAPALRHLISLDLFGNISCDAGAVALASSPWTHLQALNLRFNGVGDKGVQALARSETLSQLTRLNLTANRITDVGARFLIASPCLPRLVRLDLQRNTISAAEQSCLRDRFGPFVYC